MNRITMDTITTEVIELSTVDNENITLNLSYSVQQLYSLYEKLGKYKRILVSNRKAIKYGVDKLLDELLKMLLRDEYSKIEKMEYTFASKEKLTLHIVNNVVLPKMANAHKHLVKDYIKSI